MSNDKCKCSANSNDYIDFLTNNYLSYDDMYRDMVKTNTQRKYQEAVKDVLAEVSDDKQEFVDEVAKDYYEVASDEDIDFDALIKEYKNGGYDPYQRPIGIDMPNYARYQVEMLSNFPVDNSNTEDDILDEDMNYIKSMYPKAARIVLQSIEDECDKLEYTGSCMFDEYPDRTNLSRIIIRIYENVKNMNLDENFNQDSEVEIKGFCNDRYCPYNRCVDCCDDGTPNWLCQMIQAMFFQEMVNRRRRYRNRRWR